MTNTAAPAALPTFVELDFHPTAVAMELANTCQHTGRYYRLLDVYGNAVDVMGEADAAEVLANEVTRTQRLAAAGVHIVGR